MTENLFIGSIILENLEKTYTRSERIKIDSDSKIIVLSDFHLGIGRSRDEFRKNARLVMTVLKEWYLPQGYSLILNGDIEELHRLKLPKVSRTWESLYEIFLEFKKGPGLYKIQGNHDSGLSLIRKKGRSEAELEVNSRILPSLILEYKENEMLVLHGHQASLYNSPFRHRMNKFFLRYLAHPLHINNIKRDFLSDRPLKAEQRIFDFARSKGIIALAGHTHRALFEGHSEEEYLKIRIDKMIRDYMKQEDPDKKELKEAIYNTAGILQKMLENEDYKSRGSIYDPLSLSCLFNSGTVIHKFGATGIEIKGGKIFLTAWFDKTNPQSRVFLYDESSFPLKEHPWIQNYTLKSDDLDYIFTRLSLLTNKK
ncbi:metallophosphoesterase family protein [Oceanispirochaeta sp.]|jgi:predicted phosphodiesterase|uniref:metallophosphoesterase family protein n=1 Tax=Oceanispirochaeta sp. TaxID=2035350 RepID=UPI002617FD18|nr:metallophosphoesterase family protein [Oceanispirochaeta sp.]MDA3955722.1 metallophosphoesterase family protein [Oceanispirochaeta sp.]